MYDGQVVDLKELVPAVQDNSVSYVFVLEDINFNGRNLNENSKNSSCRYHTFLFFEFNVVGIEREAAVGTTGI